MPEYTFAFLPYLRTTQPVPYRGITFRSSEDTEALSDEAKELLSVLKAMFFLKDNYRLETVTYAVWKGNKADQRSFFDIVLEFGALAAYVYSAPRASFNNTFLTSEHGSVYWFVPGNIAGGLVKQEGGVESVQPTAYPQEDDHGFMPGYEVFRDGQLVTWVATGSRLYPTAQRINISYGQNLYFDLERASRGMHAELIRRWGLSHGKRTEQDKQILSAITWYNRANNADRDEQSKIVFLAIAFETLLNLPGEEHVTKRFTEAVTLLLGRIPRLASWAVQFYDARSSIVHKGWSDRIHFLATDDPKIRASSARYKPLIAYGRQFFQACVATLVTGAQLADRIKLTSQLTTNAERFNRVCKTLKGDGTAEERIRRTAEDLVDINEYRYQSDTDLTYPQMLGTAKLMAQEYLATNPEDDAIRLSEVKLLAIATNELDQLAAIKNLNTGFHFRGGLFEGNVSAVFQSLINIIWQYSFMYYHALLRNQQGSGQT